MDASFTQRWIRKFRILTLSLIFSGALNIGLIAAFLAVVLQDRQNNLSFARPVSSSRAAETTNAHLIQAMSKLSFRELCACLTNKEPVEEGYAKRDLALAVLAAFRHFDVEKALAGSLHQRRVCAIGPEQTVEMYPGLSDDQFKAIIQFVYLEKWPLTPEGLFKLVQKTPHPRDESLDQAFALTPQFYALQLLFQKTEAPQETAALLELASEGSWDLLDRLAKEQTQMLDLSVEKRRRILLSYLSLRSPMAARLLIQTDFAFALKRLNDQGILDLLDLLKGEEADTFCLELLKSPRSDAVWEKSASLLYARSGETAPAPFDLRAALARFAPSQSMPVPAAPAPVAEESPWIHHTVKDGESLWKIARQYKMKVEEISKANDLEKDRIFPGMTLRIPKR
ncbi:MAG: LysM peptidoglycan-binding domain-containing protein [Verrucomicrobia bacterium]|nr:LysM peptidoglycan-binding domain-containing protein [Verrucomicrobiota bacterium]